MHFNVSEIVRERGGFTRAYRVDESVVFTDDEKVQVTGSVRFVRTDKGVWVTAKLRSHVDTECGRCLDEYGHLVDVTIDEEAIPKSDSVNSVRLVEDYGVEERLVIDEDHALDLSESTRQYMALGLPMQPLCRPDQRRLESHASHSLGDPVICIPNMSERGVVDAAFTIGDHPFKRPVGVGRVVAAVAEHRKLFGGSARESIDFDVGRQPTLRRAAIDRMVGPTDHHGVLSRAVTGALALARGNSSDGTFSVELKSRAVVLIPPAEPDHAVVFRPMVEGVVG